MTTELEDKILEIINRHYSDLREWNINAAKEITSLVEGYYPKEFVEWIGLSFIKVKGGWFYRYEDQNISNLKTTNELYEFFKSIK